MVYILFFDKGDADSSFQSQDIGRLQIHRLMKFFKITYMELSPLDKDNIRKMRKSHSKILKDEMNSA